MTADVVNNEEAGQYELRQGNALALAAYSREEDRILFTHTKVPEELEGQGIGSRLIASALEDVRQQGLKAVPLCSFVCHYIDSHPETQDVVTARSHNP